jgi:hypothetical protein
MKATIAIVFALALGGCAFWKPAVKSTMAVARVLCEEYGTGRDLGMSVEDWCAIEGNLRPFVEAVTGLDAAGVAK